MRKKEFVKLVTDWVRYERKLNQLEQVGFNLTPEHPLWKISDRYGQLISEKFELPEEKLKEELSDVFIDESITAVDEYVQECADTLLE